MTELNSLTQDELAALLSELGEPKFRAKQLFQWLQKGASLDEMTNIPKKLREALSVYPIGTAHIFKKRVSPKDGTIKYLFELGDGNMIEGVLMHYSYGSTLCLSTQVGCRMGCMFCASTLNGCIRNLTPGEMIAQINAAEKDCPKEEGANRRVTNIVLMGSGEPLDNYANVVKFLKLATSEDGINMSSRNISVSTCGLVDKIYSFIDDAPHVTLSLSLHAPNDSIRDTIMPVNKRYKVDEVLRAAKAYAVRTGRRVIFEYALIKGVNDGIEHAEELSRRLKYINCHVNLIPLNRVKERGLDGTTREKAYEFAKWLEERRISATVRREMGTDIDGACGQLRRNVLENLKNG